MPAPMIVPGFSMSAMSKWIVREARFRGGNYKTYTISQIVGRLGGILFMAKKESLCTFGEMQGD